MLSKGFFLVSCIYFCVAYKNKINGGSTTTESPSTTTYFIVGGIKADKNEFPHMAALAYLNATAPSFLCGGFLINEQFVLTAGHCVTHRKLGTPLFVRLGTNSIRNITDVQDFSVTDTFVHPDYKPPVTYNDIALLKLASKIRISENVRPARLQFTPEWDRNIVELKTAGWGKDSFFGVQPGDLLKVTLAVADYSKCKKDYEGEKFKEKLPNGVLDSIQICAGGVKGKDSCPGDSGGPLEYARGRVPIVVGVTSVGKACGVSTAPGLYTRVSAYFPWIASIAFN